jgi:hypothetical protein
MCHPHRPPTPSLSVPSTPQTTERPRSPTLVPRSTFSPQASTFCPPVFLLIPLQLLLAVPAWVGLLLFSRWPLWTGLYFRWSMYTNDACDNSLSSRLRSCCIPHGFREPVHSRCRCRSHEGIGHCLGCICPAKHCRHHQPHCQQWQRVSQ